MTLTNNNTIEHFNPWTGEPLPPLPHVTNPDNWKFEFEEDGEMYHVYGDNNAPISLTFDIDTWKNGRIEIVIMPWTDQPMTLNALADEAAQLPAWINEAKTIINWAQQAFNNR